MLKAYLYALYNSGQHLQQGLISHIQIHRMSDDFLKVHGDTIVYSRITETSKTRIDYIFSNSNSCIYFQYLPVSTLDHRMALARYDMDIEIRKEWVPAERYFSGWVFPKHLDSDTEFLDQAKYIVEIIHQDSANKDRLSG